MPQFPQCPTGNCRAVKGRNLAGTQWEEVQCPAWGSQGFCWQLGWKQRQGQQGPEAVWVGAARAKVRCLAEEQELAQIQL